MPKVTFKLSIVHWSGGGWAWVRLGKIKCAAKALACVSACSSFNFAKGWHFVHCFLSVYVCTFGRPTLAPNVLGLPKVGGYVPPPGLATTDSIS